jgi:hypothetical protein
MAGRCQHTTATGRKQAGNAGLRLEVVVRRGIEEVARIRRRG